METGKIYEIPCVWGEVKKAEYMGVAHNCGGAECMVCGKAFGTSYHSFTDMDGLEILVGTSCVKKIREAA